MSGGKEDGIFQMGRSRMEVPGRGGLLGLFSSGHGDVIFLSVKSVSSYLNPCLPRPRSGPGPVGRGGIRDFLRNLKGEEDATRIKKDSTQRMAS
jgi:hypothetical protein